MKLIIPQEIEQRIHAYTMSVPSEIAGMGKVAVSLDGSTITVEEVMIYEQEVTGATADLSPKSIAKWQSELVKAGGSPKHWRLWWHSHANMAAFFSGTDTDTMDRQTEGDWMVSLVVNKRREREARLDLYRPFRMYMDKIDIQIGTSEEAAYQVPADIAEEVKSKVKQTAPAIGYGAYYSDNYNNYGASIQSDYTRDQLVSITKTLEAQIVEYEQRGQGETEECQTIAAELVDMYYELAGVEAEKSPIIAETVRAKARKLEGEIYDLDCTLPL